MNEEFVRYNDCNIYCNLIRKKEPLVSHVQVDNFTELAQKCFDYEFNGDSKVYPFEFPKQLLNEQFNILCIVGASGSGKSTLLKELPSDYSVATPIFDDTRAIVSNFNEPNDAEERLLGVGLNSIPIWCKLRKVLSVGEGFRADMALSLNSYTVFDEFTSTVDRNVAKATSKGVHRLIKDNGFTNVVFCSCHKDFIPYLKLDFVIDLDDECVYDCRGKCLGETLLSKCINQPTKTFGEFLGNIII